MSDDLRGIGAPGQRTTENTSGRAANIAEPLEHLRLLVLRRVLEVVYVALWVPVLAGPWVMAVYVPALFGWALPRIGRWLWPDDEPQRVDPGSLIAIGVLVAVVLAFMPDALLTWWPFPWQRAHADWLWLQMPAFWLVVRAVLIVIPLAARGDVRLLDGRQRQEIVAPTLSGVAYSQPAPHLVAFPGWRNPFTNPDAPALPAPAPITRTLFWRPDSGGTNGARIVDCPATIANGMQLEELAHLVLDQGISPTRSQVMRRGIFSDPGWRAFVEWASNAGLMLKTGSASSAPYVMTPEGEAWLRTVVEGEPA